MKRQSLEWVRALCIWLASWGLYAWLGGQALQFLWWICSAILLNGVFLKVLGPSCIDIKRTINPKCLYAGEDTEVTVTIQFKSWMPLPWIMLTDHISDQTIQKLWFPGFRRLVSYSYTLHPLKRGNWTEVESIVEWGDMFSWFRASRRVVTHTEFIVLPRPLSLRGLVDLPYGPDGDAEGMRKPTYSALPGQGLRDYIPGDPLNRIHWRNSARLGRLQTILPEPGRILHRCIILDTSKAGYPLKKSSKVESEVSFDCFENAIAATAGLLYSSAVTLGKPSLWTGGRGRDSVLSERTECKDEQEMLIPLATLPFHPDNSTAAEILEHAAQYEDKETELLLVTGRMDKGLIESSIQIVASGRKLSIFCISPPPEPSVSPLTGEMAEDQFLRAGGRLMYIHKGDVYEITMSRGGGEDGEIQQHIR
ncbi:DUF58 domain-containing protein [Paenibacillus sp. EC2-1]|uniref:DUF58 domain-containing protein n=1 Tax=Paenibacillus sp. EC2-1 TaxID=3388665 RepID=UPI003BEEBD5C